MQKTVTQQLEKDNLTITENYFRDSICRVILFRSVEKMVSKASWYDGGFRAQTVAYSISYLAYCQKNKFLDFSVIWQDQDLSSTLREALEQITKKVYDVITNPREGHANITQWCKKENCWDGVKNIDTDIILDEMLIDKEDNQIIKKEAKKEKKLDNGIEIQTFIVQLENSKKLKLLEYYEKDSNISRMQSDILKKYCSGSLSLPSEKQSKILYQLYSKAVSEGLVFGTKY